MESKSWLEVEIDESKTLLRKRLEELNNTVPSDVDADVVCEIEKIYKALWYIKQLCKNELVK